MARWSLGIAALAALVLTAIGLVVGLLGPSGVAPTPSDLVPVLVAMAALCVAGLAFGRAPGAAWIGIIVALTVTTLDMAAWGRANRSALGPIGWQWLAAIVCLGAVFATASAAVYASDRRRRLARWIPPLGALTVALAAGACVWVFATLGSEAAIVGESLGSLALVTRALLGGVLVLTTLGVLGDLRPAAIRTRIRYEERQPQPGGMRRLADLSRILLDELAPGRGRARQAATAERARIAADLHADVVPVVRRALVEAEHGGSSERLAVALRDVLDELDGLAADRRSVVLAELGLLPALEWLAERTEARSDVRVTIDVTPLPDGSSGGEPSDEPRPPRQIEAAAFRIAQLALENVVRHAPAASVCVELMAGPRHVQLTVSDDGPGLPAQGTVAVAAGRRGLADMRAEADACGGSMWTGDPSTGRGTVVRFAWPAA